MVRRTEQKKSGLSGTCLREPCPKARYPFTWSEEQNRRKAGLSGTCLREPCPKARYPTQGPKNKPKKTGDMRYVFTGFAHKSANPAPWDRRGSKKTPPRSVQAYGNRPKAIPDAWGKDGDRGARHGECGNDHQKAGHRCRGTEGGKRRKETVFKETVGKETVIKLLAGELWG